MSTTVPNAGVLVTGCTGFVGKVVLEELVRRRVELDIERIYVLIRPAKGSEAASRFQDEIVGSACFSQFPCGWESICEPVGGDITEYRLGLQTEVWDRLRAEVTHIIHCAASVEFDLPLEKAARINIAGTLGVQSFAKACAHLQSLVNISTAYVTPHPGPGVPVEESLVSLGLDATEVYRSIQAGTADEGALLAETGHPNTYTFTKWLAELLSVEYQDGLPLSIVRPSIVSVCAQHPFPGWIDSKAAFAGLVALLALGHLRVVCAHPQAVPDIVPCDHVASTTIACAFGPSPARRPPVIRYAVAGLSNSDSVGEITHELETFYRSHPIGKGPRLRHLGPQSLYLRLASWWYHQLPLQVGKTWLSLRGKPAKARQADKLRGVLEYLNQAFPYFTHHTYDFRGSMPTPKTERYIRTVASGVSRHLLKRDPERVPLAGLSVDSVRRRRNDLLWALRQPRGNVTVRTLAWGLRKALRLGTEAVTYDEASFEAALSKVRPSDLVVIVPSHRSYMDFMVCSLLSFAHPELGLRLPRIAATNDFACVPVVGWLMRRGGAFYIKRGMGREDPRLTSQIIELARSGETLEFFIEGTRSRGRRFLEPKRGLLRALQSTGQPCTILPIAISHDRIAEDSSFLKELRGMDKPPSRLSPLLSWLGELARGEVQLGPVHLRCGEPQRLGPESDPYKLAHTIVAELQRQTVTTTHHLRAFLKRNPEIDADVEWLSQAIQRRGGQVLESALEPLESIDPLLERSYQGHWMHLFYQDVLAWSPDNPAIAYHVERNGFWRPGTGSHDPDSRLPTLLKTMFAPVCRDYQAVAEAVAQPSAFGTSGLTGKAVVARLHEAFLPDVEDALADLARRGLLRQVGDVYHCAGRGDDLQDYACKCVWQPLAAENASLA